MSTLTYRALVAELFPRLTGGVRWGLDRTRRMLAAVGDPQRSFRVVHIGGTNGKGSVAAHMDSVLRASGLSVGLYCSPHLCSFRERIRLDGRAISEAALLAAAERLWPVIQSEKPTFFEATTAIAFLTLAEHGVAVGVIEVGLGGRLDSTNVVDPDVVVLTNVSLDHVQLLGSSLASVAREKAGIIKPGTIAIAGPMSAEPAAVLAAAARAAGATVLSFDPRRLSDVTVSREGTGFRLTGTGWGDLPLHTPLIGSHQATNAALAVQALDILPTDLRPERTAVLDGIAATQWPGRMQMEDIRGVTFLFDVAHNVAGMEALLSTVNALGLPRPLVALIGVLGDKDWAAMLTPLNAAVDQMVLTAPPTVPPDRRWDPAAALASLPPAASRRVVHEFQSALDTAWHLASGPGHSTATAAVGTVLVTGSFHTVGDALTALGRCPEGSDEAVEPPSFLR